MRSKLLYSAVLITSFFFDAVVIFVFPDPVLRTTLGLLFLLPIVWAADALGVADVISDLPRTRVRHRQYGVLRSKVRSLLDLVRRMNWLAVDLERGIRSPGEVEAEMNSAYERLKEIVDQIRTAAGRQSADPEVVVEPDLILDRNRPPEGRSAGENSSPEEPAEDIPPHLTPPA